MSQTIRTIQMSYSQLIQDDPETGLAKGATCGNAGQPAEEAYLEQAQKQLRMGFIRKVFGEYGD
jgi:hypothetical protein